MDYYWYRWECIQRQPEFQRDRAQLHEALRGLWEGTFDAAGHWTGRALFTESEKEATRRFERKYPEVTLNHVTMVIQPAPLVFDPAWLVAWQKALHAYRLEHYGQQPPSEETIAPATREIYRNMQEPMKTWYRQNPGSAVFEAACLFVPITPSTRFEHLRRLWPQIRKHQERCYGSEALAKVKRQRLPARRYEQRLVVWDAMLSGRSMNDIAKALHVSVSTAYRLYYEAVEDIDPGRLAGLETPEAMRTHVASCPTCTAAEQKGRSDDYCPWMQRHLGARSGAVAKAVSLDSTIEARKEKRRGLFTDPENIG